MFYDDAAPVGEIITDRKIALYEQHRELGLMVAILNSALEDLHRLNGRPRLRREIEAWAHAEHLFGLSSICAHLGIPAGKIRRYVIDVLTAKRPPR